MIYPISILLAAVLWWIIFGLHWINFWLGMSIAATLLTAISFLSKGIPLKRSDFSIRATVIGILSAVVLYGVFGIGYYISQKLFSFASTEVSHVYAIRNEAHPFLISLALLFITSPGEEFFWRGFLQRWTVKRLGLIGGWAVAAGIYAAVHIASGNFMLTMAALVAGAFWGGLYLLTDNLFICILSHAVWTVLIFILFPM